MLPPDHPDRLLSLEDWAKKRGLSHLSDWVLEGIRSAEEEPLIPLEDVLNGTYDPDKQ